MTSSSEGAQSNTDAEPGAGDQAQWFKKRRLQRACDLCKRKKVRCDGNQMSDSRCSNCVSHKSSCTYVEAMKRRGPLEQYVDYLENRVEKLEQLLRKLPPEHDLLKELNGSLDSSEAEKSQTSSSGGFLSVNALILPTKGIILPTQRLEDGRSPEQEQDDDNDLGRLALAFGRASIDYDDSGDLTIKDRYYGKSSRLKLVQTAIELKEEYTRKRNDATAEPVAINRRQEHWDFKSWEKHNRTPDALDFQFPPDDFVPVLIDLYFEKVNLFYPLLHRPTFQRAVDAGVHRKDYWFGALLLLVCAIGSQYTDGSRVPNRDEANYQISGWHWFQQVQLTWQNIPGPPILYNLQLQCLTIRYLQTTSSAQACWSMLGTAIRLAQEAGAHLKRRRDVEIWSLDDELKIRALWVLVAMDILISCALGRPSAYQAEDFDLDYPLEVDDEYWEEGDPKQLPKQPPGKPSLVKGFNLLLKLYQIQALTLRTIYSRRGYAGDDWKEHVIAEFDSALNKWVDSVPDYLRWDPSRENQHHFMQSALLYAKYYNVQIQTHLPFIPSPLNPDFLSFPSLTICTNAARSCSNVVGAVQKRQLGDMLVIQLETFTCGVALLMNFWNAKRCGLSTDVQKEMSDVKKCIEFLGALEKRWGSAGRLKDVLIGLSYIDDVSLHSSPPISHKREWQEEVSGTTTQGTLREALGGSRVIAGSQRASRAVSHTEVQLLQPQAAASHFQQHESFQQPHQQVYELPGYTNHNFLNQSLSSSTVEIPQQDHFISSRGNSWLSSTADTTNSDSMFTYHQMAFSNTSAQLETPMQAMAYNVPANAGTSFSDGGVQVVHNRPSAAQCRAAGQTQRWKDTSASPSPVSNFQHPNWTQGGQWTSGISHPKLRQDQTEPCVPSHQHPQALLSQHQHQRLQQQALPMLPTLQTFGTSHQQPQLQPQRPPSRAQPPPSFMEPLLDPMQHQPSPPPPPQQQQQPVFNNDNLQMWTSGPTTASDLVNWYTY